MKNTGERTTQDQFNLYEFERIYRFVSDLYGNKDRIILDYGCGSGYGSSLLSESFGEVIGIDVSTEAVDYCRGAHTHLQFQVFDPSHQPFKDEFFDCIFSFQVFEHVPVELTSQYIKNIWQMLKKGGVSVVTTPNAYNYRGGYSGNPFHVKEYTKTEIEALFGKIIPNDSFHVYGFKDTLGTKVELLIRKALPRTLFSRALVKIVVSPILLLEKIGVLPTGYKGNLLRDNVEGVIGSYYIEIRK